MKNKAKKTGLIFVIVSLFISIGCASIAPHTIALRNNVKEYKNQLNSPDLNIFWNAEKSNNAFVINGLLQNNYYEDIFDVDLYVRLYNKKGLPIKTVHDYFINLNPNQILPFVAKFPATQKVKTIRFFFDYNYAEWGGSVENYGVLKANLGCGQIKVQ